jgi:hypothetical protein
MEKKRNYFIPAGVIPLPIGGLKKASERTFDHKAPLSDIQVSEFPGKFWVVHGIE